MPTMLAIRIELDTRHARRALALPPDGAPAVDEITLAAIMTEVRAHLLDTLGAAYPGAKITIPLRFGPHGAGRTRVRKPSRTATWQLGEAERAIVAECAESLRDAAITATARAVASRRARAALDDMAAATDVRGQPSLFGAMEPAAL